MTDEQIVEAAKSAEKKTEFGELVHSFASRGVHSAYGIGFLEGAEWAREQMPLPEDTLIFRKGVEEGKRLMMEDAVEADVNVYRDPAGGESWAEFVVRMPTQNLGDKAKIIILPKEGER